jgi:transglutaminase-like putative cysteine protease
VSAIAPRPALAEPGARPGAAPREDPRLAPDRTLPAPIGRGLAFLALALFGGLHWMALLEPGEPGRAFTSLLVAGAAGGALLAAGRLDGARRQLAAVGIAVVALSLAMLAGGVPAELLRPTRWGELAGGIARGVEALPGVRVPYRGVDEWTRTVIPLGGSVLMSAAALLAFWPRTGRFGRPGAALGLLVLLYVVPAIALIFTIEFLRGAVLALLVLAFLRIDKLRVRDLRLASVVAAGMAIAGLVVAPALDGGSPWWDYETWADDASSAKTTSFSWDHSYGPLNWPRDGREMIRVKAKRPAYWKAENLDEFDGVYWRHAQLRRDPLDSGTPDNLRSIRTWTQTIEVNVRNLRSAQLIAGGYASAVDAPTLPTRDQDDGTFLAARPLRRGDAYKATIYSPQPTERQRRAVRVTDGVPLEQYLRLNMQLQGRLGALGSEQVNVQFPRWGDARSQPRANFDGTPGGDTLIARTALEQGPYAGVYRLAQRLRRGTQTQEDYVENVLGYLREGFTYSEIPPAASRTLPGFLLDSKSGYCQQYSGSMALLLRMGGVPARVATGFTSGALDSKSKEYVVRDLDAHSWVEVWYPDYGWVTFDPTPAAAPPRAQPDEAGTSTPTTTARGPQNLPGDAPSTRADALTASDTGPPWWEIPLIVVAALAAIAALAWRVWRGRRGAPGQRPALDELERALRRTRRDPGPGTTLRALESSFAGTPAAAGYVRAVRDARYGGRPAAPTLSQRRALRSELGRGSGLGGRLRAWWALPPRRT